MKLVLSVLPLLDVVPAVVSVIALWILTAAVFYKFRGNRSRAGLLSLLLLVFAARFGPLDAWLSSVVSYGIIGAFGALTEALYLHVFEQTWDYHAPKILKVPLWLFPLWSLCAMAIVNTYPVLMKLMDHGHELIESARAVVAKHDAARNKN